MKKMILLITVLAVIAVGWFLYFNESDPPTIVSLYTVTILDLENTLEFSGDVAPVRVYNVMSETGGTVSEVTVSEGSRVSAGDVLLALDNKHAVTQLKEARLRAEAMREATAKAVMAQQGGGYAVQQEKARLALALSQTTGYDYDSFNEAFGSEAAEQIQAVTSSLAQELGDIGMSAPLLEGAGVTEKQIALAELAVEQLETAVEAMTLKSTIKGTVIAVNVNKGEVLAPGVPAMVIADTEEPLIFGYVYEKDIRNLSVGMDVIIYTDGKRYQGTLTKIGVAAMDKGDISSFDSMTKVEIKPEEGFAKMLGASVDLKIVLGRKDSVLAIPSDCITGDRCVFVMDEEGIARKRAVVTGFEDSFSVEVIGGLESGERVVMSPRGIQEGQRLSHDRG